MANRRPSSAASPAPTVSYASVKQNLALKVREPLWPAVGIWRHLTVVGVLLILVGGFFANSFQSGMTLDNRYIIEEYYRSLTHQDPTLDLRSGKQMGLIFANDYWYPKGISGLYRPLTVLSYWFDYAVINAKAPKLDDDGELIKDASGMPIPAATYRAMSWREYGDAPGHLPVASYHVINLLVHWINASLLYFLALAMLKRFWPAAMAAALFATHPIVTESVTNIIGRADLFAGLTIFGGLLLYIRSTVSRSWLRRSVWLGGLMLVVGFGLFSKESSIAVGVIVPLYWLVFRCEWKKDNFWPSVGREFLAWAFMLPALIGMWWARQYVFGHSTPAEEPFLDNPLRGIGSVASLHLPSFQEQLRLHPVLGVSYLECRITALKVLGRLIGLLAWPQTLCSDYSYSEIPNFSWTLSRWSDWQAVLAVILFAAIGALTWRLWKRGNRPAVFWICFFFLAALPTANIVYAIGSIMAERFMYVPLAGFVVVVSMLVFGVAEYAGQRLKWEPKQAIPLAAGFLSVVCVVYGVRTYFRNRVWKDDETLWRDAIVHAPRSFRCYQSLAFALYERKDSAKYIDEMIALDRQGRTIVDGLPDHLNSARLYLHLGMYLSIKGDSLLQHNPDGSMAMTDAARACFEDGVATLQKGSAVDRAFDEQIKARQVLRDDPPDRITDMGLGPLYGTLALCQSRLGRITDALNSIQYQRQLDPADVDSYRREAAICLDSGRLDQAAVALIQAILIDSTNVAYWNTLIQIYSKSPEGKDAIIVQNGQAKFNLNQPLMRQHLISAYTRFVRDTRRAHRPDLAKLTHDAAVKQFNLPAGLFDGLLTEPVDICTPDGIQTGQIDPNAKPIQ